MTTRIDVSELRDGERAGLIVFGGDYAWVGIERDAGTTRMVMRARRDAANGGSEALLAEEPFTGESATLVLLVTAGGQCRFNIGPAFAARPGRWVGAKVGLFAAAPLRSAQTGADRGSLIRGPIVVPIGVTAVGLTVSPAPRNTPSAR